MQFTHQTISAATAHYYYTQDDQDNVDDSVTTAAASVVVCSIGAAFAADSVPLAMNRIETTDWNC